MSAIIIGIDPGRGGGLAAITRDGHVVATTAMPETEAELARWVARQWPTAHVYLERVRSSPQMGVVSAFTFGRNYGAIRGVLAALAMPFDEVLPVVWQRELGCLTHGDKRVTHRRAAELFPYLRITHGIADALLIAEYGRRRLQRTDQERQP